MKQVRLVHHNGYPTRMVDEDDRLIADVIDLGIGREIALTVNCHDDLVMSLRELLNAQYAGALFPSWAHAITQAEAALKKSGAE